LNLLHVTEPALKTPNYGNYALELTPLARDLWSSSSKGVFRRWLETNSQVPGVFEPRLTRPLKPHHGYGRNAGPDGREPADVHPPEQRRRVEKAAHRGIQIKKLRNDEVASIELILRDAFEGFGDGSDADLESRRQRV
jgi:hypothetical protein